ncbi:MAG: sigma 54-interacting transcriptional regulator [Desulfobacterales bacterium]|jgi:PAS domain S-box-containing protein
MDSDILKSESSINKRLRFERMISNLSARFINLPTERIDDEIENALQMVMDFFQVDRCGLLHCLPERDVWKITHAVYSAHATPVPIGTELPRSINPWAYERLAEKGEAVSFSRVDDMPDEAHVDKQTWKDWGIRSNLVLPILNHGSAVHIIAINAMRTERVWPEEYVPRLKLLGEIIVNALERQNTELALRESEERLSLAAASAEAGLWIFYPDTGNIWATEKLRELLCFAPEEMLDFDRVMSVVHPEDHEQVMASIQKCLETHELTSIEYRICPSSEGCRWIAARGRFYPPTADRPKRLMGVSFDVTEQKAKDRQLLEQLEEISRLKHQLEQENIYLRDEIKLQHGHGRIISRSDAMKFALSRVEQVAATDASVLLLGETGTGKELLARAIHRLSLRKERQMITVNCAVLPPTLVESELFGREKGAYTGAMTRMAGRFEVADGSSLFLDEIGELPLDLQAKLLKVLEDGRFERLGSTRSLHVDVRIIAATNRDLAQMVDEGTFRKDLYYRLSVFPITIAPLRERPEDVPPMVWAFVRENEQKLGKRIDNIPRRDMEDLQRQPWPGNARELRNIVEYAMITSGGGTLRIRPPAHPPVSASVGDSLEAVERRHILSVLAKTGWRIMGKGGAAEILGMKRTTLQSKMKKMGIERPTN